MRTPPLFDPPPEYTSVGSTIDERFRKFDAAHPEVWQLFRRLCQQVRQAGHKRYSARMIVQQIRWHHTVNPTRDGGLKINDHHSRCYAEKMEREYPEFRGFFEHRGRKG